MKLAYASSFPGAQNLSFGPLKLKFWAFGNDPTYAGSGHAYACLIYAYTFIPKNPNLTTLIAQLQTVITHSI